MNIVRSVAAFNIALLAASLIMAAGARNRKKEGGMEQELRVQASFKNAGDHLEVAYTFENPSDHPILVFDRMWDMRANAMNTNWAYVEIRGNRAAIKRALDRMPEGMLHENPPVPYGREIAPKAKGSGKFSLALPLQNHSEYPGLGQHPPAAAAGNVQAVGFALGWSPKPDHLPPAITPVTMNGETLYLLPYSLVAQTQRIATSALAQLP